MISTTKGNFMSENHVTVINTKNVVVAYVLWFFLGGFGVHRFYLNSPMMALAQIGLNVAGALLFLVGIGFLFWGILLLWLLFDLIWIAIRTGTVNNTAFDNFAARLNK